MNSTWAEYWLLDVASLHPMSLQRLLHPEIAWALNRTGHHLQRWELVEVVARLVNRGDIVVYSDDREDQRPSREELEAALVWSGPPYRGPYYRLTPQGGERWERLTKVDWSCYVENYTTHRGSDVVTGQITGADHALVKECLSFSEQAAGIEWERVEPWAVTRWKTLPLGHRVRFQREHPFEPTETIWPRREWNTQPRFSRGAVYAVPLAESRRPAERETALVRVLAEELDHVFVVALNWVGKRVQAPQNLATLGRDFMTLSHGDWKNQILGRWLPTPIPADWRFDGVVEVSDPERRLALSTAASGSFVEQIKKEWAWRTKGRACSDETAPRQNPELRAHLLGLQPSTNADDWRARYRKYNLGAGTWKSRLERAFKLLAPSPDVVVERLSEDGLAFDLCLTFSAGTFCCARPACHLGLVDRDRWKRLRYFLTGCPPLRIGVVRVVLDAEAVFEETGQQQTTASGWSEAETLLCDPAR